MRANQPREDAPRPRKHPCAHRTNQRATLASATRTTLATLASATRATLTILASATRATLATLTSATRATLATLTSATRATLATLTSATLAPATRTTLATLASTTAALALATSTLTAALTTPKAHAANTATPSRYASAIAPTAGAPTAAAPTAPAPTAAADPTPLLTYASTHHYPPVLEPATQATLQKQIARITFDLSKDPPPADNCVQTLGAKRFATLYDDLAQAYSNMAEHVEAVEAYSKAIDCNPRADFLHAERAASLLDLGRYTDARMETQRQLHLGRANFTLYTLLTQLDFIDEHWADAIANARIAATMAPNDEQATYWQCFLWLAQLRSGAQEPALAKRRIAEGWPAPILESLQGKITESELVEAVGEERDPHRQRDILSEALFYTGQQRLAAGQKDEAVKYFTATVNLKVVYFIEHQLATAELRKLRPAGVTGQPRSF